MGQFRTRIDCFTQDALEQIKDIMEGKQPSFLERGGVGNDVRELSDFALWQIRNALGGGSEEQRSVVSVWEAVFVQDNSVQYSKLEGVSENDSPFETVYEYRTTERDTIGLLLCSGNDAPTISYDGGHGTLNGYKFSDDVVAVLAIGQMGTIDNVQFQKCKPFEMVSQLSDGNTYLMNGATDLEGDWLIVMHPENDFSGNAITYDWDVNFSDVVVKPFIAVGGEDEDDGKGAQTRTLPNLDKNG